MNIEKELLDIPEYVNQPEYVTNKLSGFSLQVIGWFLWMWLLMPLFTLILWFFEGKTVYEQFILSLDQDGRYSLYILSLCIFALVALLLTWASYNWVRFYNVERRMPPQAATEEQLAKSFNLNVADVTAMKKSQNITLHYDDQGNLIHYEETHLK